VAIVVRSLSDLTYELVRKRILAGDLAPGAPLRQDAIADELGVSKIPLREALGRLEQDGLLSSNRNRGYAVRPLSAEEAAEVFELRLKIEPAAAAAGARAASEAQRAAATAALAALEEAQAHGDLGEHMAMNRVFHMALIRPCGSVTYQLLERLHILAERYVRVHLEPTGREARARREHRALLKAWAAADGARVETLVAEHIRATRDDLLRQLAT
jgi:DNA-binding GntR family transcriptional regulator